MEVLGLGAHVGGCQNAGPLSRSLNIRDRIIMGTQETRMHFDKRPCKGFPTLDDSGGRA